MSFTYRTVVRRGVGPGTPHPERDRHGRRDRRLPVAWTRALPRRVSLLDVAIALGVVAVLYGVVVAGRGATASLTPGALARVDTSPARLPEYAARSLLRMFVALAFTGAFTFVYAPIAASGRRAERVLVPLLDVLQSVPVLGFLSITVTGFVRLFPHSVLGLECASIFAIFTAQAWNVTLGFYQSLRGQARDLDEAARLLGLSRWRRFWKLDVPSGAGALVWNGMMGMGGGWFFLVASESITVVGRNESLPGVGSYIGAAIAAGDLGRVGIGAAATAVLVAGVNWLFWQPLVAWSHWFDAQSGSEAAGAAGRSAVLDLLHRSHWPRALGRVRRALAEPVARAGDRLLGVSRHGRAADAAGGSPPGGRRPGRAVGLAVDGALLAAVAVGTWRLLAYLIAVDGWAELGRPLRLGLATLARVVAVVVLASAVWTPVGIAIGRRERLARIAQPVVQLLASFPANVAFPLAVWAFVRTGLGIEVGAVALMALGAQWYVLFNAIAGVQAVPVELVEASADLGLRGWHRWWRLWLPAVVPAYVTGAIAAAGGAWNASIVAEVATYGTTTLHATGLGAWIVDASQAGDLRGVLAGVTVMAAYVVVLNRVVWAPLQHLAARRFAV